MVAAVAAVVVEDPVVEAPHAAHRVVAVAVAEGMLLY